MRKFACWLWGEGKLEAEIWENERLVCCLLAKAFPWTKSKLPEERVTDIEVEVERNREKERIHGRLMRTHCIY